MVQLKSPIDAPDDTALFRNLKEIQDGLGHDAHSHKVLDVVLQTLAPMLQDLLGAVPQFLRREVRREVGRLPQLKKINEKLDLFFQLNERFKKRHPLTKNGEESRIVKRLSSPEAVACECELCCHILGSNF